MPRDVHGRPGSNTQPRRALASVTLFAALGCGLDGLPFDSCPLADNGVCDEPERCRPRTDDRDCRGQEPAGSDANVDPTEDGGDDNGDDSAYVDCPWPSDGQCDEPEGTDFCVEGSDPQDCGVGTCLAPCDDDTDCFGPGATTVCLATASGSVCMPPACRDDCFSAGLACQTTDWSCSDAFCTDPGSGDGGPGADDGGNADACGIACSGTCNSPFASCFETVEGLVCLPHDCGTCFAAGLSCSYYDDCSSPTCV